MRWLAGLAVAAMSLLGAASVGHATVYTIDQDFGNISLSGFFETDGTTGTFTDRASFGATIQDYAITVTTAAETIVYDQIFFGGTVGGSLQFAVSNAALIITSDGPGTANNRLLTTINTSTPNRVLELREGDLVLAESIGTTILADVGVGSLNFAAVSAVPEPAALPILAAALAGFAALRRRRRRA